MSARLHVAAGTDRRLRFVRSCLASERNVSERRPDWLGSDGGLSQDRAPSQQRRRHFGQLRLDVQGLLPRDLLQQLAPTTIVEARALNFYVREGIYRLTRGTGSFGRHKESSRETAAHRVPKSLDGRIVGGLASACPVEIHRLTYLDRGLITVDPIDVGNRPARIGVVVHCHPRASGEDASLKGSRNRRFGDLCGMSAVEQRSSKIDQFSRVRDHVTTSARLNFTRAKHLRAAFGSVTVRDRLSHSHPRCG